MSENGVVQAIEDLTRVTIALSGGFGNKSETVRKLAALSIPASRIGGILAMESKDVCSVLAKARKKGEGGKNNGTGGTGTA